MVDPKVLELSLYEGIPHLLLPVITDPRKAQAALQWAVNEMERRIHILHGAGVRNLDSFIGKTFKFKVIKFNKKRGNIVLSRRVLLEKERDEMKQKTLKNLEEGMVLQGTIKNLTEYVFSMDFVEDLYKVVDVLLKVFSVLEFAAWVLALVPVLTPVLGPIAGALKAVNLGLAIAKVGLGAALVGAGSVTEVRASAYRPASNRQARPVRWAGAAARAPPALLRSEPGSCRRHVRSCHRSRSGSRGPRGPMPPAGSARTSPSTATGRGAHRHPPRTHPSAEAPPAL